MKKVILIAISLVWTLSLIILIISLTDIYPNNIFQEYRTIIGVAFISITGLFKPIYNSVIIKSDNSN